MYCVKATKAFLLPQNEDDSIVTVATTGMHRKRARFIHHHHFTIIHQNLHGLPAHRGLVTMHCVPQKVIVLDEQKRYKTIKRDHINRDRALSRDLLPLELYSGHPQAFHSV